MRNSTTICIDANIVVKLLIPQTSGQVLDLWTSWKDNQIRLVAPSLIFFEVTNALYQMTRQNVMDSETATLAATAMMSLPIDILHLPDIHRKALDLAIAYRVKATCDTHYLALSEHLGCELWTADQRFFHAVHDRCDWVRVVDGS